MRELEINLKEITNHALRSCGGKYYYFDENGVYRSIPVNEAKKILNNIYERVDGSTFYIMNNHIFRNVDLNILRSSLVRLKLGESFDELKEIYQKMDFQPKEKPKGLDRFITKIDSPRFIKMPENQELKVFDFIHIDAFVVTEWESDIYKYILDNQKEIIKKVIKQLKNDRSFKKYCVPINFLKLTKVTYSKSQNLIRFVFELKEVKNNHE